MKAALLLSVLASAAASLVAAQDLEVKVTLAVDCDRKTKIGDSVSMHYIGTLAKSGKQFDSSRDRGEPFTFTLGAKQVIEGWDKGLLDMCIGEKRTLIIPPKLGYGQQSVGPIPAGSTLIFKTELMGIEGVPKPDKIKTKASSDNVGEKVASAVSDAANAAETIVADTDDVEAHKEL